MAVSTARTSGHKRALEVLPQSESSACLTGLRAVAPDQIFRPDGSGPPLAALTRAVTHFHLRKLSSYVLTQHVFAVRPHILEQPPFLLCSSTSMYG